MKHAKLTVKTFRLADLKPHPRNPRQHPEPGSAEWEALKVSLAHDYFDPVVVNSGRKVPSLKSVLVSGHLRTKVMAEMGVQRVDAVVVDYDEAEHEARMIAANRQFVVFDDAALAGLLAECETPELAGMTDDEMGRIVAAAKGAEGGGELGMTLAEQFGVPPFSVLDARQGYWQDRKRAWLAIGIKSEIGRGGTPITSARAADGDKSATRQRGNATIINQAKMRSFQKSKTKQRPEAAPVRRVTTQSVNAETEQGGR